MIRAIIFDLDNCVAPADEVGAHLLTPIHDAITAANHGTLSTDTLNQAFADSWRYPLDWVAMKYGFSEAMQVAAWSAGSQVEVSEPMHGYGDHAWIAALPVQRFLVTSGFRRLQTSKIKALGLEGVFAAVYVDAIDEPERQGKRGLFRLILERFDLAPAEVLVVGDTGEAEIKVGNELGIRTVQTLRPGVPRADNATYYIHSFAELGELVALPAGNEA